MNQTKPATILLVDNDEVTLDTLKTILTAEGHDILIAQNGQHALKLVVERLPNLVLLNIRLPDMDSLDLINRLKTNPATTNIPIILVTAQDDQELRIKALNEGGTDFICTPIERVELLVRIGNILKILAYQTAIISQSNVLDEHFQWPAQYDGLTGLPNRALLGERINLVINMAHRNHTPFAVMFLDLDHFKNINDTLGHHIGDALLKTVARDLQSVIRKQDTLARQGGDEFILVLPDTNAKGAQFLARKVLEVFKHPFQIEQYELVIKTSIGIAMYPTDGDTFELLSKQADIAMYRAKSEGRNKFRFFTQEMQMHSARTLQIENALHRALKHNLMHLDFQPKMLVRDGSISGVEALLRWKDPELGMVSPAEFIPVAESSGQILEIGEWVLRHAIDQLKSWIDRGMQPMIMAINLSAVQLLHPDFPELITQMIKKANLPPRYIELELTEVVAMKDPPGVMAVLDNLNNVGIRMSIDDFGTGYSSMNYFKRLQVYRLKIHQSFVNHMNDDLKDKSIVISIINMARSLGMQTTAEGVESEEQFNFLRENGCNEVQGYYISKPLQADEAEAFIRSRQRPLSS